MTDTRSSSERRDAELAARVEAATRPAAWQAHDLARFRSRVAERASAQEPVRRAWRVALVASAASCAVAALLWAARPAPGPELARSAGPASAAAESLDDSFEEQLLFSPEWIERDDGFVDGEVLPESYALASALLDS